jgi:uncharacterized protein (UPF0332 family)
MGIYNGRGVLIMSMRKKRSLLSQYFVKTGKIQKEIAKIYNDLFERRQEIEKGQILPKIAFIL